MIDMTFQNNPKDPLDSVKTSIGEKDKDLLPESDLNKVTGGGPDTSLYKANCAYCQWYWPADTFNNTATQMILHNALGGGHNAVMTEVS
jgi:hypothetical protein